MDFDACEEGDYERVLKCLNNGADVNEVHSFQQSKKTKLTFQNDLNLDLQLSINLCITESKCWCIVRN
jgi:hypothetical protein